MKAYILKLIGAILVLGLVGNISLLIWLPHSGLFGAAKAYIFASNTASNAVGRVAHVTPSTVGFKAWMTDQGGEATLQVVIDGTQSRRRAIVTAVKHEGKWTVTNLVLNGVR